MIEEAVLEEKDYIKTAGFSEYQFGWRPTDIGYYSTFEHHHQVWLYAQKAAAFVCRENTDLSWRPSANVSNISWAEYSFWGPRASYDDVKYAGELFLSSGYIWMERDKK